MLGRTLKKERKITAATLDWSQCPAVESFSGKVSGAWVFKDTRMPVATVFENLEAGLTVEEVMEEFAVTRTDQRGVAFCGAKFRNAIPSSGAFNASGCSFDHGRPRSIARWLHSHVVVDLGNGHPLL
jgi:uncharacterized protein (DUF433 family)